MSTKWTNDELRFIEKSNYYFHDGTKMASLLVRNCIRNIKVETEMCDLAVTKEELEAIRTLVAGAMQSEDVIPNRWYCDNDCCRVASLLCPGECSIDKKSNNLCPHFIDEGNI